MSGTIPQTMINGITGEQHVIQLKPRGSLTVADVEAFLADRREAGKLVDLENCETTWWYTQVLDSYGIFEVPDEYSCIGRTHFVRSLPNGCWVAFEDVSDDILKVLFEK